MSDLLPDDYSTFGGSQLSLLPEYTADPSGNLVLRMSGDNPRNTTFFSRDDPVYNVTTTRSEGLAITLQKGGGRGEGGGQVIGTIVWTGWQDRISVGSVKRKALGAFFRFGLLRKSQASFEDPSGKRWTWCNYAAGKELTLLSPSNELAAEYTRSRRSRTVETPAYLTIYPNAFPIQDLVVFTFIALEKNRRLKEGMSRTAEQTTAVSAYDARLSGAPPEYVDR